jgi:hypothetical protein
MEPAPLCARAFVEHIANPSAMAIVRISTFQFRRVRVMNLAKLVICLIPPENTAVNAFLSCVRVIAAFQAPFPRLIPRLAFPCGKGLNQRSQQGCGDFE